MEKLREIKLSIFDKLQSLGIDGFDVVVTPSEFGIFIEIYSYSFRWSVINSLQELYPHSGIVIVPFDEYHVRLTFCLVV